MKFPELKENLAIISQLGDNPNVDDGLTSAELKAKFDAAALIIQQYLNKDLVSALDEIFAGGSSIPVDGLNMNGAINMNNNPLQNVRDPASDHEAINLKYARENFITSSRKVNGKPLSTDIILSASDVNARPNTWLPTIAEIGAAPSGYGLGSGTYTQDFNTCLANGWYYGNASTANGADGFTTNCSCFVIARNASQVVQYMFYPWSGLVLQRWTQDGGTTWHEEWVNPPLEKGVEYRTTERIQGKAVYKRTSDWGRIEYRLDGETIWHSYISNGIYVSADLTTAGWYKIGTVNARGILSASVARLNIGGNFNSASPYSAIVEVACGYGWSKAVTTLATGGGNSGMSKIATVNSNSKVDIYGYYTNNNRNTVSIVVDASTEAGFVSANLEAAPSFNESSANSVASTLKAGYVSREILWENSSPTSIFAGQTVTLKDSWEKYDSIGFQCNKGYGEMLAQAGQMCYVAWYFANDNGSVVVTHRFAEVVSGGIKISDVQTLTTGSYSTQNDRITPLRIYGIKGVN